MFTMRLIVVCLLVSMAIGIIGLPMPVSKSTNERFPCEKCACSCTSAAHCWDKCCCKTDEEKLAWAQANQVTPPQFLVARVAAKGRLQVVSRPVSKPACCAVKTPNKNKCCASTNDACCSAKEMPRPAVAGAAASKSPASQCAVNQAKLSFKLVLADAQLQCQGSSAFWKLLQSTYIPLNPRVELQLAECLSEGQPIGNLMPLVNFDPPDGPVPRPATLA